MFILAFSPQTTEGALTMNNTNANQKVKSPLGDLGVTIKKIKIQSEPGQKQNYCRCLALPPV